MAILSTSDYSINRDDLIKASLRLLGIGSIDEDPTAAEITNAVVALNIMVKAWIADGLQLWQVRQYSLTPVTDTSQYSLGQSVPAASPVGHRPSRIIEAYYRNTSTVVDVPMIRLSREEYWGLSDKNSEGTPVQFYYDPQLTNGQLYVWPEPDSSFISDFTIELLYQKPFADMDENSTDDFEFPSEWYEAIKYGLAARLAPEYGTPLAERQQLVREAIAIKEAVKDWDTEDTSIFLHPDYKGMRVNNA